MEHKTWLRPKSVPYPTVWSKFTRTDKNGKVLHFEIQDITEDLFSTCIQYMTKYFLTDEPFYACLGFSDDEVSIKEQQDWWKEILSEKLSLICLLKDTENTDSQIAGINFMYYHHKSHDTDLMLKGKILKTVMNIIEHVENQISRYDLLKMEDYLDDFGLCVHPDFRGMGIATEILKARDKLGSAVGLSRVLTMFTAIGSQKAADKAGYKNLVEMKYSDLEKVFSPWTLDVKDTPTIRYMYRPFLTYNVTN